MAQEELPLNQADTPQDPKQKAPQQHPHGGRAVLSQREQQHFHNIQREGSGQLDELREEVSGDFREEIGNALEPADQLRAKVNRGKPNL